MSDEQDDLTEAQTLYQIVPGERLEYASRYPLAAGEAADPEATATETGYDVVIAVEGSGHVSWDDEKIPIVPGMSVAVPPEATYTISAAPDEDLEVMVIGIASDSDPSPHPDSDEG